MNLYRRALAMSGPGDTDTWGSITGSYSAFQEPIVYATKGGGTTNVLLANYVDISNGTGLSQVRISIEDSDQALVDSIWYQEKGSASVVYATGGWQTKGRLAPIAIGITVNFLGRDFGSLRIDERSTEGDRSYFLKFDLTGV